MWHHRWWMTRSRWHCQDQMLWWAMSTILLVPVGTVRPSAVRTCIVLSDTSIQLIQSSNLISSFARFILWIYILSVPRFQMRRLSSIDSCHNLFLWGFELRTGSCMCDQLCSGSVILTKILTHFLHTFLKNLFLRKGIQERYRHGCCFCLAFLYFILVETTSKKEEEK